MNRPLAIAAALAVLLALILPSGCKDEEPCTFAACPCVDHRGNCIEGPCTQAPPSLSDPVWVVPSDGLPLRLELQPANNNLDVVVHQGRVYLAFRTAPDHWASPDPVLYVVSSCDEGGWRFEFSHHEQTDLREPRFLSWNGRLFLYFAVLGDVMVAFEPQGIMVTEMKGRGDWTDPEWIYLERFMVWRTKVIDDVPYMLGYIIDEYIPGNETQPTDVHWLTTSDGRHWEPVIPGQPVVLTGGGSETDFVFADDGALIAVNRNESGDDLGWGSKICRAEPGDLGNWQCVGDPKKYDSPLMFKHGSDIYLIGRRNVTADGNYDLFMRHLTPEEQTREYMMEYWHEPKRCSLWRVNPTTLEVTFVLDLPSAGDTCFPALLSLGGGFYRVYNYTSPLDNPDLSWLNGQLGDTMIYRVTLAL